MSPIMFFSISLGGRDKRITSLESDAQPIKEWAGILVVKEALKEPIQVIILFSSYHVEH
jgi:hypothetical protein